MCRVIPRRAPRRARVSARGWPHCELNAKQKRPKCQATRSETSHAKGRRSKVQVEYIPEPILRPWVISCSGMMLRAALPGESAPALDGPRSLAMIWYALLVMLVLLSPPT